MLVVAASLSSVWLLHTLATLTSLTLHHIVYYLNAQGWKRQRSSEHIRKYALIFFYLPWYLTSSNIWRQSRKKFFLLSFLTLCHWLLSLAQFLYDMEFLCEQVFRASPNEKPEWIQNSLHRDVDLNLSFDSVSSLLLIIKPQSSKNETGSLRLVINIPWYFSG